MCFNGQFKDKVALVTGVGGDKGIGFAAANILGIGEARLAITDIADRVYDRAAELKRDGMDVKAYSADLTNREQVKKLVEDVVQDYSRIDILVNCAGMVAPGVEWSETTMADLDPGIWDRDMLMNLGTCFNATRWVLPRMIENQYGRIVNVASVTGPLVSNPGSAAYSAAKSAIVGMSRSLAIEVGKYNITVNNIAPGWIHTGESLKEELIGAENTPMERAGTPGEVGDLIAFLASDAASYITGQMVVIDGGNTIQEYKGPKEGWY